MNDPGDVAWTFLLTDKADQNPYNTTKVTKTVIGDKKCGFFYALVRTASNMKMLTRTELYYKYQ